MKDLFKSRKFLASLAGTIIVALEATILHDKPELLEMIVMATTALTGLTIAGQAHADANDGEYGKKRIK